jgi:hypothetical protein
MSKVTRYYCERPSAMLVAEGDPVGYFVRASDYDALAAKLARLEAAAGNVVWYEYSDCGEDVQDAIRLLAALVPDYCVVYRNADGDNPAT